MNISLTDFLKMQMILYFDIDIRKNETLVYYLDTKAFLQYQLDRLNDDNMHICDVSLDDIDKYYEVYYHAE